ncbi:MAG TPA: exopolyphosphatase [Nitrospirota bacterium]|nr:exopolyphosphatase [Nitrospirota bacterium]
MRLVTRGDLDGLVSAVLITTMEKVDSLELIHPQDITDNKFPVKAGDILANLPYHPNASLWFDHHELTDSNRKPAAGFKGKHAIAPSAARVVYEYYQAEKLKRFEPLLAETDRFDSGQLSIEDISDPKGAVLLGFTIDPRTGFGIDRDFFMTIVELFKTSAMDEVLRHPEVARRIDIYRDNDTKCLQALKEHSRREKNVIITDFRPLSEIPPGNRFLIYMIFPAGNVSIRLQWGPQRRFIAVTLGHSIFNRTCDIDIGQLCSDYGGGGHRGAGACPLSPTTADAKIAEIITRLKQ